MPATSVLAAINDDIGGAWRLEQRMTGGLLGGAWRVNDGSTAAVLKWHDPSSDVPRNPDAPAVVEHIRIAGYPTPAWLASGTTPQGFAWSIQELVEGEPSLHLDATAARRVLDLVRLQRTICPPTAMSWTTFMRDTVATAPPDLRMLAAPYESAALPDDEMVHCDLSLSNIIFRDGKVTGVVDIDATGRGCAVYDLLNVALNGLTWNAEPDALALLHEYALDTYERAARDDRSDVSRGRGLAWGSAHRSDRSDELGIMYRTWLRSF